MKKIITLLLSFIFSAAAMSAQNLVLNPSLESYITCPGFGQFSSAYINNWSKPSYGSTDYYNMSCAGIQPVSQYPHGGEAYFGIIAFNYSGEYREYATAQLSAPLVGGTVYLVTFYVSLNDGYIQAVNELGAYLSATAPGPFSNTLHIAVTPQVENTSGVLSSDTSWMLVSGIFTAAGGEQYITIGNFHNDAATTVTLVGSSGSYGAYYFIDDVSVVPNGTTGIESSDAGTISVYPNPVIDKLNINLPQFGLAEITLYDIASRKIAQQHFTNSVSLNTEHLAKGIYIYEVSNENGTIRKGKIVKE
jgi:hypothetical protein